MQRFWELWFATILNISILFSYLTSLLLFWFCHGVVVKIVASYTQLHFFFYFLDLILTLENLRTLNSLYYCIVFAQTFVILLVFVFLYCFTSIFFHHVSPYRANIPLLIKTMYLVCHTVVVLFIELILIFVTRLGKVIIGSSQDVLLLMSASGVIL